MKKRNTLLGIILLALFFTLTGFTDMNILKDFASFDRAFIPPLALTNQDKLKPSQKAIRLLNKNWESFKTKYYNSNPQDPEWKEDFDRIGKQIAEATSIVESGENLMHAHEALEEIRSITLDLRRRNNIEYYIDYLTEFHFLMESIVHTASDNEPADMGEEVISELSDLTDEASAMWSKIEAQPFDKALFGFDDEKIAKMMGLMKAESEALDNLKKAINSKDKTAIIEMAKNVKPNYAKIYMMFGDFDSIAK